MRVFQRQKRQLKLRPGYLMKRLPEGDIQLSSGNIQALDMAACQRIVQLDIAQDDLQTVAAGAVINGAYFVQVRTPGANPVYIDVKCLKAREGQPMFHRQAKQSRQGEPKQKKPEA